MLASLSSDLAQARQQLRQVEERFTAEAPATIEQRALVKNQLKMVKDYVVSRAARAQKEVESLDEVIARFEDKLKTVPAAQQELARLSREAEVLGKVYAFLLERQQQAAVTKASTISRSRVLDAPETPHREEAPALLLRVVLAGLLGLSLGVVAVIARWVLSRNIQSEHQARRALGERRIMAAIPQQPPGAGALQPAPALAEAFRHLRTGLYQDGPGGQVVVITSPSAGDGKTLCTLSLASALAADGKRVLVLEADMHRPSMARLLDLPRGGDLGDLLTGRQTWLGVVQSPPVNNTSFEIVPVHTPCPDSAELLSGRRFSELLAHVRTVYDFVLLDTPPFPVLSDALILSLRADRVLSVIRLGNTSRQATEKHLQGLAASPARHGVIVNGADTDQAAQAYYLTRPSGRQAASVLESSGALEQRGGHPVDPLVAQRSVERHADRVRLHPFRDGKLGRPQQLDQARVGPQDLGPPGPTFDVPGGHLPDQLRGRRPGERTAQRGAQPVRSEAGLHDDPAGGSLSGGRRTGRPPPRTPAGPSRTRRAPPGRPRNGTRSASRSCRGPIHPRAPRYRRRSRSSWPARDRRRGRCRLHRRRESSSRSD